MKEEKQKGEPKKSKKSRKKEIPYNTIIIGAAALIVLVAVLVCFMSGMKMLSGAMSDLSQNLSGNQSSMGNGLKLDENAEDYKGGYEVESQSGSIAIPGFDKLRLRADSYEQTPGFFNPESNTCYFVIQIKLADGTVIYESGLLAPGKAIYSMKLSQTVPEGTYPASVVYSCYSVATMEEQNGAEVKITLEVTK